jgi:UDP-2,3-diacylglucosamine hydrolase
MITKKNHLYFVSDAHLGVPNYANSLYREQLLIKFLNEKSVNAKAFYIVGDLFDFWFEYKHAVPKGYFRLLAKLAELVEQGIEIHLFTGNHDMWIFDYLPKEVGLIVHREPIKIESNKVKMYIAHGDGLGPGDRGYKFIKKVFASKTCQWLFARLHPNFGIGMANYWSRKSRKSTGTSNEKFLGEDKEWLAIYSKDILSKEHIDYFIYGHRHLPMEINLNGQSKYINLGDWIQYFTYAEFDGTQVFLKQYPSNEPYLS